MGYVRRKVNARRLGGRVELYRLVLATMEREQFERPTAQHINLRDRFILVALSELGLRASEIVGSSMGAFYQRVDPKSKVHYWIFNIVGACAKGGKERKVPVI